MPAKICSKMFLKVEFKGYFILKGEATGSLIVASHCRSLYVDLSAACIAVLDGVTQTLCTYVS